RPSCDARIAQLSLLPVTEVSEAMPARRVSGSAGRLSTDVQLDQPGVLLLSSSFDPGWGAVATDAVSGRHVALEHVTVDGLFNGWRVPAGRWHVSLVFGPAKAFRISLLLSLIVVILAIAFALWLRGPVLPRSMISDDDDGRARGGP